jgi:S1-C subfamily serine protease
VKKALLIAALVLVLGLGGGFAIGRATADSGPSSLADAVQKSANGDLPLGSTNGTLQKLLQQLARNGGLQRALQNLLGQLGRDGNGRNLLPLNPNGNNGGNNNGGNNNGGNNNGSNNNGGNTTPAPTTSQAFLGVAVTTSDNGQGVVIGTVQTGSPAADAGLKAGDVITAVDGTSVNSAAALSAAVRSHQPGDSVRITYTRGGTSADVQVRLGNRATANTTAPTAPQA